MCDIKTMQVDTFESLALSLNEDYMWSGLQKRQIIKDLKYDIAAKNSKTREFKESSKNQAEQIKRLEASNLSY